MLKFLSKPKSEKGQGLVKYVIFLAFVAIIMLGVMQIFNPRIGSTLSSINTSLDASGSGNVTISGSFQADDLYWNNPANGCKTNYTHGDDPGCDAIIERVQACLAGATGTYCDDYFAVAPR